ncbi:MAG: lysophospholipid acyltransferase family protein [Deltaproteobacteria bacterium]|nr:lysophospholipid acyltransferase family protein [Deltaproteobacteria bacterium]
MRLLIKKIMILFMWYPLRAAIKYLPLKLVHMMGVAGGYILCMISGEKNKVMASELGRVLPGGSASEIRKIIRDSFTNYCISEIEVLLYPAIDKRFIERIVKIEGRGHLDKALARGKGVLLFQAHFGAFQMTMPAIGYSGYRMNQISASAAIWKDGNMPDVQKKMFDIKAKCEYSLPVRHISVNATLRPLFNALKMNEIVGITVDGGGGKRIAPITFLGREAYFQTGAAEIALNTGAEIVPAFITTGNGISHHLFIHPPIRPDTSLGREENIMKITREFAALLEGYVYRHPGHYGYTLCLRRLMAPFDPYPFFTDYDLSGKEIKFKRKATGYA